MNSRMTRMQQQQPGPHPEKQLLTVASVAGWNVQTLASPQQQPPLGGRRSSADAYAYPSAAPNPFPAPGYGAGNGFGAARGQMGHPDALPGPMAIIISPADPNGYRSPYSPYPISPNTPTRSSQQATTRARSPAYTPTKSTGTPAATAYTNGNNNNNNNNNYNPNMAAAAVVGRSQNQGGGIKEQFKPQANMSATAATTQTAGRKQQAGAAAASKSSGGGGSGLAGSEVNSWDTFCCCFGEYFESICGCCTPKDNSRRR